MELHSAQALSHYHKKDIPAGVTGFDDAVMRIMTGAMTSSKSQIKDIYTPISKVFIIYLDTMFNLKTALQILEAGFSRIPVAHSKEKPVIVGTLLVKTVLAVDLQEKTIGELFFSEVIDLKRPLFLA